jgi:hypothetical protein
MARFRQGFGKVLGKVSETPKSPKEREKERERERTLPTLPGGRGRRADRSLSRARWQGGKVWPISPPLQRIDLAKTVGKVLGKGKVSDGADAVLDRIARALGRWATKSKTLNLYESSRV